MLLQTMSHPPRAFGRKRVGINAHLLSGEAGYRRAGIHHYIMQILRHLPREEDGPEYLVFTQQTEELTTASGIHAVSSRWPTQRRLVRIIWEQLVWPWSASQHSIDLLHSMAFVSPIFSKRPFIVTVYDLSFIHYPDSFPALQRLYLTYQTRHSVHHARHVITISESGRRDVHQFFGVPLEQISVVHPGLDPVYRLLPEPSVIAFRQQHQLPDRFLLHVGTLQPRKNIPVLLQALAQLPDSDLHLVLVGGKGWLFDTIFQQVVALGLQDRVHFTGYVPDKALPLWYNAATAFILPSLYEGFGMPVVEAMACGTPVIAANTSSIPEAVGTSGLLFDPYNAAELADRIMAVLHDPALLAKMKADGRQQATQFSWERAGQKTAVIYRQTLQRL